jgi:hypothetical protein
MASRAPGSIRSLVFALGSVACMGPFGLISGIIAIVFLLRARSFARRDPEAYTFGGTAWLATGITAVGMLLSIAITCFLVVFAAFLFALVAALAGYLGMGPAVVM